MRVLSVVGNRPQFVKSAPLSVALRHAGIDELVVHSGQHYDRELSQVFFDELGLGEPDYRLDARTRDVDAIVPGIAAVLGARIGVLPASAPWSPPACPPHQASQPPQACPILARASLQWRARYRQPMQCCSARSHARTPAVRPALQYSVDRMLSWFRGLADLPGKRVDELITVDLAKRFVSHQHPDHET